MPPNPGNERAPAGLNGRGAKVCELVKPRGHSSAIAAEQALLGALLMGGDARPPAGLQPGHMGRSDHRAILAGILAAVAERVPADAVTVAEVLEADGTLSECGGLSYLVELANNAPGTAGLDRWADIIRDAHRRRRAAEIGGELAAGADPGEALARLQALAAPGRDLARIDLADLAAAEPPPVRWCVDGLIPAGHVSLLGGHGGAGKSLWALILAAHVSTGRDWAGFAIEPGRALFLSLEDGADLVRWRLRRLCDEYALPVDVVAAGVTLVCAGDAHCALMVQGEGYPPKATPTAAMRELGELARGHSLVIIDGASDAFDADENRRRDVRAFLRELVGIARQTGAAVVLLAHIDKAAARYGSNGQSFSGSTAWHNSARSRLALVREDDRLELRHEKSNLGPLAEPVALRWTDAGVLVPADPASTALAAGLVASADAEHVLTALRAAIAAGVNVSTARTGPATTQHVLATMPELPATLRGRANSARFWLAVSTLQKARRIWPEEYRTPQRKAGTRWAVEATPDDYRKARDGE